MGYILEKIYDAYITIQYHESLKPIAYIKCVLYTKTINLKEINLSSELGTSN